MQPKVPFAQPCAMPAQRKRRRTRTPTLWGTSAIVCGFIPTPQVGVGRQPFLPAEAPAVALDRAALSLRAKRLRRRAAVFLCMAGVAATLSIVLAA